MNIRTSPVASLSVEELILAQAHLGVLSDRVHENGHDVPDSLKAEAKAVERELDERLRADKERRLSVLKLRREGLLTQTERRKNVEAEIDALEAELNPKPQRAARVR